MKFHDFSPFYRSGEGIRSKVSGDRLIDNPAVADAQGGSGASFNFDGTDDVVTAGDDASFANIFTGGGTISGWINPASDGEGSTGTVITTMPTSGTGDGWVIYKLNESGGKIGLRLVRWCTGSNQWNTDSVIPINEWSHFVITLDDSDVSNNPTFYLDGVSVSLTKTSTGTGAGTDDTGNNLYIGNHSGADYTFDGQISQVRLHNRALSAAEVRAAYNGQAVPYEYVGGSQTNLVYNTFTNDVFSNGWAAQGATITYDAGNDRVNFTNASGTSSGYHGMYWTFGSAPESGKKYRYSYTVVNHTEGTHAISIGNGTWSPAATGNGTFTGVIESSSSPDVYIRLYPQTAGTDNSFGINSVSVTQIGCVAEYLPSGINATQWVDTSGNNLHGTTSTATAVNHTTGTLTLESGANLKMQDGGGIDFTNYTGEVTTGTATANLLDDYEEGTWTAGFTGTTSSAVSNTTGYYVKIGRAVHFSYYSGSVTFASSSGDAIISGLPFVSTSDSYAAGLFWYVHGNAVDGISTGGHVVSGNNTMYFIEQNAVSAPTYVDGSSKYMKIVGTYYV